ncbi:MAG: hypothetical protein H0X24_23535 [Ktedonobacterales bacterium]|nr:hypothetical protein [Ktedonobacterales bacterium]
MHTSEVAAQFGVSLARMQTWITGGDPAHLAVRYSADEALGAAARCPWGAGRSSSSPRRKPGEGGNDLARN